MKGIYYKLPIDFEGLMKKQDLAKIALEDSISQSIYTLITTTFEAQSLKNRIAQHEKRITTQDIEVTITEQDLGNLEKKRIKKKVLVSIKAIVLETNRPYTFKNSFFVSPLSY